MLVAFVASVLFIGDSVTHADPAAQPWIESGFAEQLGGVNRGVPAATTISWIQNFDSWAKPYLEPDQTVHVLLGVNDAGFSASSPDFYAASMKLLIQKLSGDGRRVVVSTPYRIGLGRTANRLLAAYARRIDSICAEGLAERGASLWADPPELHDGVHPTQAGQDHIARLLRPLLMPEPPEIVPGRGAADSAGGRGSPRPELVLP